MEEAPPVTILGTEYPALADGQYDAIFLGTGLKECILAGLLSVKGMKVLVVDRNDYYGGESASLNLTSLFQKFRGGEPSESDIKRLGSNRDYNVDLIPKFLMACGKLVKMLYITKVTRYLDFKVIEGSFVYRGAKKTISKVPSTASEALSTDLVGFFQKRKLKSFLSFISEAQIPGEDVPEETRVETDSKTMKDIYDQFGLDDMCRDFLGHAMALRLNDSYLNEKATKTVKSLKLYGYSLDKYGSSPYIYPVYGLGGLPEGFSRLCAIHGGVFMLQTAPSEILFDGDKACGVVSDGRAASAKYIIGDPSYFDPSKTKKNGSVIRSICILNHSIKGATSSAQIIIPANQIALAGYPAKKNDIYISLVSFDHQVAPQNIYVAIVSTMVETSDPKSEVQSGIDLLGDILERYIIIYI